MKSKMRHVARKMAQSMAIAAVAVILTAAVRADDWPQWRGPNRDGVWHEKGIIESFPAGGLKISWRVPIGPGFSSPVIAQHRVYVTDSQIAHGKAHERVLCFDAASSQTVWTHSYEVEYADWALDPTNQFGPRPTPIIGDGRLFTLGARGRLLCFEADKGKIVWQKDLATKSRDSAFTPSPLIEGDLLIFVLDALSSGPYVVAFNKNSGKEVWSALDETMTLSSPIVVTAAGKRQLIVWTQGAVNSLDPTTGKVYWRERHQAGASYAVPTPVARGDLLFINGVMYKLASDKPAASLLWPNGRPPPREMISETSAAMFTTDHLFMCNLPGELVCIEAKTGKILWATHEVTDAQGGGSIHITPNGKSAFLFNDKGELIVAEITPAGYKEISRASLLEPTSPYGERKMAWTPPAYAGGRVFARSDKELVCASLLKR